MKKIRVAIFGSTSHIAKGLILNFLQNGGFSLHLYSRSSDNVRSFLGSIKKSTNKNCIVYEGYTTFPELSYDVIINCVGVGTLKKLQNNYTNYFTVTEEYDNLAVSYLRNNHPDSLYFSFSSGAIYGRGFSKPAEENTINKIRVNHVAKEDYYSIVRLNCEAKHRAFSDLNIVDLRLFSYFSRFIDLTDGYFITELLSSILKNKVFLTDNKNIIRDYVHPEDLFSIIKKCIEIGKINAAFDITSTKPAKKTEILAYFASNYGLKYKVSPSPNCVSPTGSKNAYYSRYLNAASIGYKPAHSSLETIKKESKYILNK